MIPSLKNAIFCFLQSCFAKISTDYTKKLPQGSVLIIAPHPDDETLGCGASIARFVQEGRKIRIVIVTDGRASPVSKIIGQDKLAVIRQAEAIKATEILGLNSNDIYFLHYKNQETDSEINSIEHTLSEHIKEFLPNIIFAPSEMDFHPEHQLIANIIERLQDAGHITGIVLQYPIWFKIFSWNRGILKCLRTPSLYHRARIIRADGFLDVKKKALAQFPSQFENFAHEDNWDKNTSKALERFYAPYELFFERQKNTRP